MLQKITSISYLPVSDISDFRVKDDTVEISKTGEFIKLSSVPGKTSPTISPKGSDAGTLYSVSISSKLLSSDANFKKAVISGCILRVRTADNKFWILGSHDFPLRGCINKNIAATAKAFSGYNFSLSCNQGQLHQLHANRPIISRNNRLI